MPQLAIPMEVPVTKEGVSSGKYHGPSPQEKPAHHPHLRTVRPHCHLLRGKPFMRFHQSRREGKEGGLHARVLIGQFRFPPKKHRSASRRPCHPAHFSVILSLLSFVARGASQTAGDAFCFLFCGQTSGLFIVSPIAPHQKLQEGRSGSRRCRCYHAKRLNLKRKNTTPRWYYRSGLRLTPHSMFTSSPSCVQHCTHYQRYSEGWQRGSA